MVFKRRQHGFTVVELMIAISVFSVLTILVTTGVVFIARQYQQASTRTRLEDASREIHQQFSQSVQFSAGAPREFNNVASTDAYTATCIGNQRYVYPRLAKVATTFTPAIYNNNLSLPQGLYVTEVGTTDTCNVTTPAPTTGVNLLPPNSRVLAFTFTEDPANFTTTFVAGDSDLLNLSTAAATKCNITVGSRQFCAVVNLTSSASRRVVGN